MLHIRVSLFTHLFKIFAPVDSLWTTLAPDHSVLGLLSGPNTLAQGLLLPGGGMPTFLSVFYIFSSFSACSTPACSLSLTQTPGSIVISRKKSLFNADPVPDQVLAMGSTATESVEEEVGVFQAFRTWPTHQRPTQMG